MAWRPQHAVELVAGTPPGGGQDRPARALIQALAASGRIDAAVNLVNIPGRGGANGWDRLAREPGEPHLLAISSPPLITNQLLGGAESDERDLTPLAILYTEYIAFVVRADSPLRDAADLIGKLAAPGSLTVALATAKGNTNHIALGRCVAHAGGDPRDLKLAVFDSALHAVAHVVSGEADLGAITAVSAAKDIAAGRVRALAVSAPQRLPGVYADIPTCREAGVDCMVGTWRGVVGTPRLTPEQVAYWDEALQAAAQTAEWKAVLSQQLWVDTPMDSRETRRFLAEERRALGEALGALGLGPDRRRR